MLLRPCRQPACACGIWTSASSTCRRATAPCWKRPRRLSSSFRAASTCCCAACTSVRAFTTGSGTVTPVVRAQVGLRLIDCALVRRRRGAQIAIFEDRDQLSGLYVVAAVDQKLLHRRGDLRHHVRLVLRPKNGVGLDDAVNRRLLHGGDLHGRGRFHFLFFLLRTGDEESRARATRIGVFRHATRRPLSKFANLPERDGSG